MLIDIFIKYLLLFLSLIHILEDFHSSIGFDCRMYREDITGSIAHAQMLGKQGIIPQEDAEKIVRGLKEILIDIEAGKIEFSAQAEDIHMNIENLLTQRIGEAGKRLHTCLLYTSPALTAWKQRRQ